MFLKLFVEEQIRFEKFRILTNKIFLYQNNLFNKSWVGHKLISHINLII